MSSHFCQPLNRASRTVKARSSIIARSFKVLRHGSGEHRVSGTGEIGQRSTMRNDISSRGSSRRVPGNQGRPVNIFIISSIASFPSVSPFSSPSVSMKTNATSLPFYNLDMMATEQSCTFAHLSFLSFDTQATNSIRAICLLSRIYRSISWKKLSARDISAVCHLFSIYIYIYLAHAADNCI